MTIMHQRLFDALETPCPQLYLRGIKLYATKIIRYHQWINSDLL